MVPLIPYTADELMQMDELRLREVRGEFFTGPDYPASTLIGDIKLARPEFLVEIEAVVTLA